MSSLLTARGRAVSGPDPTTASVGAGPPRGAIDLALGVVLGAALVLLAFVTNASGELAPATAPATWSEIVIGLVGAGICGSVIWFGAPGRAWGAGTVALFALMAGFTALSIVWSVRPDDSWLAANLTLAYLAAFAAAAGLARIAPERWPALIGAVAVAAIALSGWALLVKVFPGSLDAGEQYGRLQQPFGYWNATGLIAGLGLPAFLWIGSCRGRRGAAGGKAPTASAGSATAHNGTAPGASVGSATAHNVTAPGAAAPSGAATVDLTIRALSVPASAILISVVVLSYSRSAVLTAVVGVAIWFVLVPLRLRAVLVLALGGAGALVLIAWALSTPSFNHDAVAPAAQTSAGHTFGVTALLTLAVLTAAGIAAQIGFERVTLAEQARRRIGVALVVAVALIPVGGLVALAASSRGLTGEVSHEWNVLTSPNQSVGNSAGRLTQLGNSRSMYWREGLKVGEHALFKGVGALGFRTARTRYTTDQLPVQEAHSYVIQTFADLGLIGVAISLALLIAWIRAAMTTIGSKRGWASLTGDQLAERCGLLTLLCVVVMFGVQSATDWTWYIPGVTVLPLLCAGWLAGRGPLDARVGLASQRARLTQRPGAGALLTVVAAAALLGAWVIWQPLRSADALSAAGNASNAGDIRTALSDARSAAALDPLSTEPLFVLSALDSAGHDQAGALTELQRAVALQPDYAETWFQLGDYELGLHRPRAALAALNHSLALDLSFSAAIADIAQARSELASGAKG